jgi:hypothetical protein
MNSEDNLTIPNLDIKTIRAQRARDAKKAKAEAQKNKNNIGGNKDDDVEPISYHEYIEYQRQIQDVKNKYSAPKKEVHEEVQKEVTKDIQNEPKKEVKKKVLVEDSSSEDEEIKLFKIQKKKEKLEKMENRLRRLDTMKSEPVQENKVTTNNIHPQTSTNLSVQNNLSQPSISTTQPSTKKSRKDLLIEQLKLGLY